MREVSAGSRVWVKEGEEKQFGVFGSISIVQSFITIKGSMLILLDDGHGVLATSMSARGTTWDLVPDHTKDWP
jgi:hypothetical protein